MSYSERAYFEGDACQHVAAYEERQRLAAIAKRNRAALRSMGRDQRRGSRARAGV